MARIIDSLYRTIKTRLIAVVTPFTCPHLMSFCRNLFVMMLKFSAYLYTGSASLMSETIHSFADAANQVIAYFTFILQSRL